MRSGLDTDIDSTLAGWVVGRCGANKVYDGKCRCVEWLIMPTLGKKREGQWEVPFGIRGKGFLQLYRFRP